MTIEKMAELRIWSEEEQDSFDNSIRIIYHGDFGRATDYDTAIEEETKWLREPDEEELLIKEIAKSRIRVKETSVSSLGRTLTEEYVGDFGKSYDEWTALKREIEWIGKQMAKGINVPKGEIK